MSAPVHTHQEQPHTSNQNTSSKGTALEPKDYGLEILDKTSLKENGVQAKLTIGAPDDPFEKEADAMASYAVGKIRQEQNTPTVQAKCEDCEEEERRRKLTGAAPPRIQRKCAKCEKKRIQLKAQSKSSSPTSKSDSFTSQLHSQQGLGSPLPKGIKGEMEAVFGADFGGVRVHEGAPAVQMNQELGAKAFTHQSDIYFNKGQFQPGTTEGKTLVAHELTHVVQQGAAHQSTETPSVQTDLLDDALDAGSNLLSQGADAVSGAVDYGREGIASLVGRFSPGLARIIRVGPLNFIKEKVGGLVKGWFENLQNGIGFGDMVTGLRDWLGDSVADIRGAITGHAKSCTAFGKMIESVRGFVFKALEHPVLNMIRGGIQKTNDVIAKVLSMYIQGEIQKIKFIWEGLQGLGSRVSGWIDSAKEGLGVVWGKAKEFLGITEEGEAGIMDWISGLANDAWDFFKNKYIPFAIKAFKTGGKLWFKLSGLEAIYTMVTAIGDFWETFSWLWEHRNDPDLVAKAAKDEKISKTILPRILEKAQNLQATLKDTQKAAISWVDDLILKVLGAIGIVTEVPILSTIVGFLEKINRKLEQIRDWIIGTLSQLVTAFGAWVSNLYQQIKPILSIAAWLLIAVAVPGALPVAVTGILAAGLFAIIPTCYKGPVMDLLLDIAIKAMKLAPDVPMFGPLWSLFKPGVIEFLQVIRDKSTEEKLAVIKRVAELLVFSGIDFLLGFGWGLIKGIFEGIFDPFILIYYAGKGLVHLISWFSRVANQYFGDATPAPPLFGGGADKPKKKEAPLFPEECSDDKKGKAAGADTAELESLGTAPVMQAGPAVGASAGEGSGTALATPNPAVGDQIWGWMNSLAEPAYTIRNNFTGAINEYFSQSGGMDYNSIQSKFGQWWGAAQGAIAERSGKLANCMVATLLSPGAQKIASKAAFTVGEVIGWISGTIIIEVVLFLLSSGLVTVTKAILKPLVWLAKLIDKIGDMFMVIFKVLKPLGKMFMALGEKLFSFFGKSAGAKMAKVMEAFSDIGRKLLGFVDNVPGLKLTETGRALAGKGLKETGEKGLGKTLAEQSTETAGKQGDQVVEEFGEAGHKELLDQARRKQKVDDMTEAEFRAELGELAKNPKTDVSTNSPHFEKYDVEVKVNGHTYRRRRDGKGWCRFTLRDCFDQDRSKVINEFFESAGDEWAAKQARKQKQIERRRERQIRNDERDRAIDSMDRIDTPDPFHDHLLPEQIPGNWTKSHAIINWIYDGGIDPKQFKRIVNNVHELGHTDKNFLIHLKDILFTNRKNPSPMLGKILNGLDHPDPVVVETSLYFLKRMAGLKSKGVPGANKIFDRLSMEQLAHIGVNRNSRNAVFNELQDILSFTNAGGDDLVELIGRAGKKSQGGVDFDPDPHRLFNILNKLDGNPPFSMDKMLKAIEAEDAFDVKLGTALAGDYDEVVKLVWDNTAELKKVGDKTAIEFGTSSKKSGSSIIDTVLGKKPKAQGELRPRINTLVDAVLASDGTIDPVKWKILRKSIEDADPRVIPTSIKNNIIGTLWAETNNKVLRKRFGASNVFSEVRIVRKPPNNLEIHADAVVKLGDQTIVIEYKAGNAGLERGQPEIYEAIQKGNTGDLSIEKAGLEDRDGLKDQWVYYPIFEKDLPK